MKTVCNVGLSPVSTVKKFTTTAALLAQATTGASQSATAERLEAVAMPNPNNGNFSIDLHLPANKANTTLRLYNNLGEKVWQEDLGAVSGSISKNIYLENKLPSDVYVMMIERNDARYSMRIVISK